MGTHLALEYTWLTTSTRMAPLQSTPLPGTLRGRPRGSSAFLATGPSGPRLAQQSFLGSRCYTLFLGRLSDYLGCLGGCFLSSVSFGIQLRPGGSSQISTNIAMKQFPLGRKKRLIRLIEGSACAFVNNWQNQDISLAVFSGQLLGFCSVPAN